MTIRKIAQFLFQRVIIDIIALCVIQESILIPSRFGTGRSCLRDGLLVGFIQGFEFGCGMYALAVPVG